MAEFTRRQLADQIGCTKQTVMLYERELDLEGHVSRRGQAVVYDEVAASAIASRAGGRFADRQEEAADSPADFLRRMLGHYRDELVRCERLAEAAEERHQAEIERLQELLVDERELTHMMRAQLADAEERGRAAVARAAEAEARASKAAAALAAVDAAPFWRKGALARAALALPSPQ